MEFKAEQKQGHRVKHFCLRLSLFCYLLNLRCCCCERERDLRQGRAGGQGRKTRPQDNVAGAASRARDIRDRLASVAEGVETVVYSNACAALVPMFKQQLTWDCGAFAAQRDD